MKFSILTLTLLLLNLNVFALECRDGGGSVLNLSLKDTKLSFKERMNNSDEKNALLKLSGPAVEYLFSLRSRELLTSRYGFNFDLSTGNLETTVTSNKYNSPGEVAITGGGRYEILLSVKRDYKGVKVSAGENNRDGRSTHWYLGNCDSELEYF